MDPIETQQPVNTTEGLNKVEIQKPTARQLFKEEVIKKFQESLNTRDLTPEQKKAEIDAIAGPAKYVEGQGIRSWVAGGGAIDLSLGDIQRKHGDTDIAVMGSDVEKFFDSANSDYAFVRPVLKDQFEAYVKATGRPVEDLVENKYQSDRVTWVKVATAQELRDLGHNAFLDRRDSQRNIPEQFELIMLHQNENGDLTYGSDKRVTFPKTLYDTPPTFTTPEGNVLQLTPKEVQIMYKLDDGRAKDFEDIKRVLPTLSDEEKQRMDGYLKALGATFEVDGEQASNVNELLKLAEEKEDLHNERFFKKEAKDALDAYLDQQDPAIQKIMHAASITEKSDPAQLENHLVENLLKEDGITAEMIEKNKKVVSTIATHLANNPDISGEELQKFIYDAVNLSDGAMRILRRDYQGRGALWQMKRAA